MLFCMCYIIFKTDTCNKVCVCKRYTLRTSSMSLMRDRSWIHFGLALHARTWQCFWHKSLSFSVWLMNMILKKINFPKVNPWICLNSKVLQSRELTVHLGWRLKKEKKMCREQRVMMVCVSSISRRTRGLRMWRPARPSAQRGGKNCLPQIQNQFLFCASPKPLKSLLGQNHLQLTGI